MRADDDHGRRAASDAADAVGSRSVRASSGSAGADFGRITVMIEHVDARRGRPARGRG